MTIGDIPLPAAGALDHHHTVAALKLALPGWLTEGDPDQYTAAAEQVAASLARQGLALVPLDTEYQPDLGHAASALQKEAETSWFAREKD